MIDCTIVRLLTLYFNNAINKWLLSIFIQGISEMYSNFILDLFILEGNLVIFKAVYAVFVILEKYIKNLSTYNDLNSCLLKYLWILITEQN